MDDLISRQAAIDAVIKHDANCGIDSAEVLKALPSAQSERKKGKWRVYEGEMTCSCCETTFYTDMCEYIDGNVPKFCPKCGADMREEKTDAEMWRRYEGIGEKKMTKHVAIKHLSNKIAYYKAIDERWVDSVSIYALEIAVRAMENERKKGKWILSDEQRQEDVDNGNYRFICSECGKSDIHSKAVTVSFCWNCGADMREEKNDGKDK